MDSLKKRHPKQLSVDHSSQLDPKYPILITFEYSRVGKTGTGGLMAEKMISFSFLFSFTSWCKMRFFLLLRLI